MYSRLARLVLWLHAFSICGLLGGVFAALFYPACAGIMLLIIALMIGSWVIFKGCFLTHLENHLWRKAGRPDRIYSESCIPHYYAQIGVIISHHQVSGAGVLLLLVYAAIYLFYVF